jgi:type II secretory pathway pseudopilin PulG
MRVQRAFTLVEVLVIVMIFGALAVIAVPRLPLGAVRQGRAEAVAMRIVSDLRLARRLAIANAAENTRGFKLEMIGRSPYGAYEIVNRQTRGTVSSRMIDADVICTGTDEFEFSPLGNLDDYHSPHLTVSADGKTIRITVVRATGMVKCE